MAMISRTRPRRYAVAVSALFALVLCVLSPWAAVPAWGHPYLVQTVPGPGVELRVPPTAVQIGFTERVVLEGSSLRLDDGDGQPVALGPLHTPKEGPGLAADIKGTLGGDVYLVRWSVLGDDGHSSSGEFRFGVDGPNGAPPKHAETLAATGGPADQSANSDGPIRIALRWLGLFGASLLVGGAVLLTRLRGRLDEEATEAVAARWGRLARLAWVLTLAGSIAGVVAAAGAGAGGTRMSILLATSTGGLALARVAGVVLAGLPGVFGRPGPRRDQFLGMAGAFFLGAEAVGGHITAVNSASADPGHRGPGGPPGLRRHVGRWARPVPEPRTYEEAAQRLGLPATTVRKRIEGIRHVLVEAGVPGLEGGDARRNLSEWLLSNRLITADDLVALEGGSPSASR